MGAVSLCHQRPQVIRPQVIRGPRSRTTTRMGTGIKLLIVLSSLSIISGLGNGKEDMRQLAAAASKMEWTTAFSQRDELELAQDNLLTTLPKLTKEWKVSLEVNPTDYSFGSYANVLHMTIGGKGLGSGAKVGDRTPAIWIHKSRVVMISSALNGKVAYTKSIRTLPPAGEWTSIEVGQSLVGSKYYCTITIGGKSYLKITNSKPVELSNVKVFAGSPWYTARKGMIRNLEIEIKVPVETTKPPSGSCVVPGPWETAFSLQEEHKIGRNELLTTIPLLKEEWKVSFDFKASRFSGLTQIFHMTAGGKGSGSGARYGDRTPAIWTHPTRGFLVSSAVGGRYSYSKYFKKLPSLNEWTTVEVGQEMVESKIVYYVAIGGERVFSYTNSKPSEFEDVKVYAASNWYTPVSGSIKNLLIQNKNDASVDEDGCMVDWVPSYSHESEHLLKKNGLLTTLPSLGKEWRLTFEIKPTSYTYRSYAQVLQMTIGGKSSAVGDRTPSLWFHRTRGVYIAMALRGKASVGKFFRGKLPRAGEWTRFEIKQEKEGSRYMFSLIVGDEELWATQNTKPVDFEDVKVYAASPWYVAQAGSIRDFHVENKKRVGGSSEWSDWGVCLKNRTRPVEVCTGGGDCPPEVEVEECEGGSSPVDGSWAAWTAWTSCSATCDWGTRQRKRSCTPPQQGGQPCEGEATQTEDCRAKNCPVDGQWLEWGSWSMCLGSCDSASRSRGRACTAPAFNGRPCSGDNLDTEECDLHCPEWTEWAPWSSCSVSCGGGSRSRDRNCTLDSDSNGLFARMGSERMSSIGGWPTAMTCPGEPSEMEPCGDEECPAPGNTSGGCQCGMRRPGDSSSEDSFEQPWIGKLQLATRDFYVQDCSATLIASDWAVTAAHCLVDRSPDEMVLQLGNEFSVDADSSGNATLGLTDIIFHPEYDESGAGGLSYDVALIKLSGSADARFHWPACLPSQDADYTGDMGWMYVWGESSMVPLVEDDICSQAGNSDDESFYAEDMICAGGASGAEVCSVEHGSPLTVEVDGRNIVTGVSSWTLGCGGDGRQYAVYSELAKVRTWIEESMAAAGGAAPCNSTSGWNSTATWGSWGAWSGCSENCDRSRERDCLFEDGMVAPSSLCDGCRQDDISCSSGSIEYEDCEDGLCGGSTTEGTTTEGTLRQNYMMYSWATMWSGECGPEEFVNFTGKGPCVTATWDNKEKRDKLWCVCNRPGREI